MSSFPPISDYGFISDCENSCLIAPDGSIEWMCLPRPDAPSIFGALLDRTAGTFRFGPSNTHVPHQRRYLPGTMIMETTWHTPNGWLLVQDFLSMGPVRPGERRPQYRRPSDVVAIGHLVRVATCIGGRVEVVANCVPLLDYGTTMVSWEYNEAEYQSMSAQNKGDGPSLTLTSSIMLGTVGARCYGHTNLEAGESCFVALSWDGPGPTTQDEAVGEPRPPSPSGEIGSAPANSRITRGAPISNAAR